MGKKTPAIIFLILITFTILAGLGYYLYKTRMGVSSPILPAPSTLKSNAKLFSSDVLGVGFSYIPTIPNSSSTIAVSVIGNKIYVYNSSKQPKSGQSIEVFTKDPAVSLETAIKTRFLMSYNQNNCFVVIDKTNEQGLANHVSAEISYPPPSPNDTNAPWWANSNKCPQSYTKTNGVQYFLMNKNVPGKFIFVAVGQYSITSDGATEAVAPGGFNWSHSIRILK